MNLASKLSFLSCIDRLSAALFVRRGASHLGYERAQEKETEEEGCRHFALDGTCRQRALAYGPSCVRRDPGHSEDPFSALIRSSGPFEKPRPKWRMYEIPERLDLVQNGSWNR